MPSPSTDSPWVLHPTPGQPLLPSLPPPLLLGWCSRREGEKARFWVQAYLQAVIAVRQPAGSRARAPHLRGRGWGGLRTPYDGWERGCASGSARRRSRTPRARLEGPVLAPAAVPQDLGATGTATAPGMRVNPKGCAGSKHPLASLAALSGVERHDPEGSVTH